VSNIAEGKWERWGVVLVYLSRPLGGDGWRGELWRGINGIVRN